MNPAQTIHRLELLDGFNADGQALLSWPSLPDVFSRSMISSGMQNSAIGVAELLGFRRALQGKNTGQNRRLFGETCLADGVEPLAEGVEVKYRVRLNEPGASLDFLAEPEQVEFQRFQERIRHRPDQHRKLPVNLRPVGQHALFGHPGGQLDELGGINVENVGGFRTADQRLMIAGQAKHILDPQTGGSQQIGLEGDAVPVAGDHLENRFGARV